MDKFIEIATEAYKEADTTYTLEDALSVFTYFFAVYKDVMHQPHPPIRKQQIIRIMEEMPYIEQQDRGDDCVNIEAECYPV